VLADVRNLHQALGEPERRALAVDEFRDPAITHERDRFEVRIAALVASKRLAHDSNALIE